MKKIILKLVGISLLAFYFLACDDDDFNDPFESIPIVQFKVPFDSVKENEGEKTIILSFSQPFKYDATIRVLVDTSKVKHFTSTPVAVSARLHIVSKAMAVTYSIISPMNLHKTERSAIEL